VSPQAQLVLRPRGSGGIVGLEGRHDIRIVKDLQAHEDVGTSMIYAHVLNRGSAAVRNPMDRLLGEEDS